MKKTMPMACALSALLFAAALGAQEAGKTAVPAPQAAPDMSGPKPGPEHELLKKDVGTWDATVEIMMPDSPPATSKGVETNRLVGGLWLVTDFKSTMMGQPFQGHGISGYDVNKKKYVGTWTDTMSTGLYVSEGTYDPATKTATGWMEGPDETGKPARMKSVVEYKDDDTRVFTMYRTGPDGKEAPTMKITYKRRAAGTTE